jgi:hypothetical protein
MIFFSVCAIYEFMVRDMGSLGTYSVCREKLFETLEIRFMFIGCDLPSNSVVDPHWFQCGSGSVSSILGQC